MSVRSLYFDFHSPLISVPPSSSGGFHVSVMASPVILEGVSGPPGGPGLSTTITSISALSEPKSLVAVIVYLPESPLTEADTWSLVPLLVVSL